MEPLVALKYVTLKILLVCIYYPLFSLHQSDLPLEEMGRHFELGDWKLLYLLSANMEPLVFGEFIRELYKAMKDANANATAAAANAKQPLIA